MHPTGSFFIVGLAFCASFLRISHRLFCGVSSKASERGISLTLDRLMAQSTVLSC